MRAGLLLAVALLLAGRVVAEPALVRVAYLAPVDELVAVQLRPETGLPVSVGRFRPPAVTDYLPLAAGTVRLVVTANDDPAATLLDSLVVVPEEAGARWTLLILQFLNEPRVKLVRDLPPTLTSSQAAVRLINAVPDLAWLRVILRQRNVRGTFDLTLAERLTHSAATEYVRLDRPGPAELRCHAANAEDPTSTCLTRDDLRFLPGRAYSLVVVGFESPEGDDDLDLRVFPLVDAVAGQGS